MSEKREPVIIEYNPKSTVELAIKRIVHEALSITLFFMWMHGLMIVQGFWMTLGSAIFFPYPMYLSFRFFLGYMGWLPPDCSG